MTRHADVMGTRIVVFEPEDPQTCMQCGSFAETRPYDKNGIEVCFGCAMLDEKTAREQLTKRLLGDTE